LPVLLICWHERGEPGSSEHDVHRGLVHDIERPLVLMVGKGSRVPLIYSPKLVYSHSLAVVVLIISLYLLSCESSFLGHGCSPEVVREEFEATFMLVVVLIEFLVQALGPLTKGKLARPMTIILLCCSYFALVVLVLL
jgi:hypothetical protein